MERKTRQKRDMKKRGSTKLGFYRYIKDQSLHKDQFHTAQESTDLEPRQFKDVVQEVEADNAQYQAQGGYTYKYLLSGVINCHGCAPLIMFVAD